jgi:hypothetical protein
VSSAVRFLYALAVAIFFLLAVVFGVLTFYPSPESPRYPESKPVAGGVYQPPTPAQQGEFDREYEAYEDDRDAHHRNVLLIATVLAALAIIGGVAAARALDVLRVGLMLGGLFTVIWALAYAGGAADTGVLFIAALLVLFALVALSQERVRTWLARTFRLGEGDDLLGR